MDADRQRLLAMTIAVAFLVGIVTLFATGVIHKVSKELIHVTQSIPN